MQAEAKKGFLGLCAFRFSGSFHRIYEYVFEIRVVAVEAFALLEAVEKVLDFIYRSGYLAI